MASLLLEHTDSQFAWLHALCPKTQTNFEQRASTLSLEAKLAPFNISVKEGFELAKAGQEPYLSLLKAWAKRSLKA